MKSNTKLGLVRCFSLLLPTLLLALVTACGGGNGSAGTPIGGTGAGAGSGSGSTTAGATSYGAITLTLANATSASNTIAAGGSLIATAHVVNAAGGAVANAVVTFSVSSTVGSLPIASALTNSSGNAVVNLQQGSTSGAATLTATSTVVGTNVVTGTVNFQSGSTSATASPMILLALANVNGCAASTVNTSCPLTANATVTDATGSPIANSIVTFANTLAYAVLSPSSGTVLTNSNGVASVIVSAAGLAPNGANNTAGTINVSTTVGGVTVVGGKNFVYGNTPVSLSVVQPTSLAAVNAYGTKIIQIQVNANGVIYTAQPVTVSFSSNCASQSPALATLPASATTVNGIATVTYTDKGCAQTDTVTASASGQAVSVALAVATPSVASINFISAVPSDKSIVLLGAGGTGRTSTATLTFQVVNFSGQPVANANVTFTNNQTTIATLNTTSGTTAADGTIAVTVTAGSTTPGTFAITATTPTTSAATVSAISSGIVVSTGVPTQASFTVAPLVLNIEGFSVAGTTTTVTTYIADANGHAVVDGTPVEASTDEGSIGSSSSASGGCTTLLGKCGLTFTSQNPRCLLDNNNICRVGTIGVATISATSTNNTTLPLSGTTYIYMSDGNPTFYYISPITGSTSDVTGGAILPTNNCSPNIFLTVADINGNPLPYQTSFAVTTTTTNGLTLGAIFPGVNSNIGYGGGFSFPAAKNGIVNGQGITIPFTLGATLPACSVSGAHTASFNFSVSTKSPLGIATQTPFVYTYPIP